MDPSSPILLFDTGVGGLTVYDALREVLPDAPVIFAADYAGLPYGKKTEPQVAARVAGLLGRMSERFKPRLACIACNTASTIALGMVREVLEIPIVGTVPAIKPAAALTTTGTIGLIGTQATIRQAYVDDLERDFASEKTLLRIAAPDFVDEAEGKLRGRPVDLTVLERAAEELQAKAEGASIDTLVLACTHFPLLKDEIARTFGADISQVDGASGIARRIAHLLDGQTFEKSGPNRFVVVGDVSHTSGLDSALTTRGFGLARTILGPKATHLDVRIARKDRGGKCNLVFLNTRARFIAKLLAVRSVIRPDTMGFGPRLRLRRQGQQTDERTASELRSNLRFSDRPPPRRRALPGLYRYPSQQGRVPQCALLPRP